MTSIFSMAAGFIREFTHGVLGLAENPARGPGFWSQNTEDVAFGCWFCVGGGDCCIYMMPLYSETCL